MVDLNVYRRPSDEDALILVPELLGSVQADLRQVVRVVVQGESPKARIVVDKIVHDDGLAPRSAVLASVDDFMSQVQRQVPGQLSVARTVLDAMQQIAARSKGAMTFALRGTSANLYLASPLGARRFLSLRADGRLRLVLAYLRTAGLEREIDELVGAAPPAFTIRRDDRAGGVRYLPAQQQRILDFLSRVEHVLTRERNGQVEESASRKK